MIRASLGIRDSKFFHCLVLVFICSALSLKVRAAQEEEILQPASVKVYSGMSDSGRITASLIFGNVFEVIEAEKDDTGVTWYRVKTDLGVEGYVKADELDRMILAAQPPAEAESTAAEESGADAGADTPDEESSNNDMPDGGAVNNDETDMTAGEVITLDTVNLRSQPSVDSKILSKIKKDIKLSYFQRHVNDDGEVWYNVEYDGKKGYVIDRAVSIVQEAEEAEQESYEEDSSIAVVPEKALEKKEAVQKEAKPETQTAVTQGTESGAKDESDIQMGHKGMRIDFVLIMLIVGGILCTAAIVLLVKRILSLLRK